MFLVRVEKYDEEDNHRNIKADKKWFWKNN